LKRVERGATAAAAAADLDNDGVRDEDMTPGG